MSLTNHKKNSSTNNLVLFVHLSDHVNVVALLDSFKRSLSPDPKDWFFCYFFFPLVHGYVLLSTENHCTVQVYSSPISYSVRLSIENHCTVDGYLSPISYSVRLSIRNHCTVEGYLSPFYPVILSIESHCTVEGYLSPSSYPVILSIENHCNVKQQQTLASIMKEIFGEKIFTDNIEQDRAELPSPEFFKRKILIKASISLLHICCLKKKIKSKFHVKIVLITSHVFVRSH